MLEHIKPRRLHRAASDFIPPYRFRQRWNVASLIPKCWITWARD